MPRSYYNPYLDDPYLDDVDPYDAGFYDSGLDILYEEDLEDVRYERPLSTREAVDALMRSFFPEDEPVKEILTVDPQKKATFNDLLARCRLQVQTFGGRIEVRDGCDPGDMDIHIYIGRMLFHNATDPNFLQDLGRAAHMLIVNPHEEGLHIQISLPFYNLEY